MQDAPEQEQRGNKASAARVRPIPPRFWWLKRLGFAALVLAIGLILLRIWWGYEAHRRLQAKIDQYRAMGQLVTVEEFDAQLDAVDDADNAAILLEQAMNGLTLSTAAGVSFDSFLHDRSLFDTDMASADELIESNAAALQLVRQARDRPQVAWSDRLTGPNAAPRRVFLNDHPRGCSCRAPPVESAHRAW